MVVPEPAAALPGAALPSTPLVTPTAPARGTVAVALGAGGARGLAHIHIAAALDELGIKPVAIAGSSIGAIIGAGYAAGMSGADIADYTLELMGKRITVANRLLTLGPSTMRDALGGFRLGQFNLERILGGLLPPEIPAEFEALRIPLTVMVTDYYGQCSVALERGDLVEALAASAAIPALFMPVRIHGRLMIDGGIFSPIPYDGLRSRAEIVIGVDVVGAPEGIDTVVPSRIDSLFGASQLMMQAQISAKLQLCAPDIFLRPAVNRFRIMDFLKARQILAETEGIKDELKRALDARLSRDAAAEPAAAL